MLLARGAMPVQAACSEALATAAAWPLVDPYFTRFRPGFLFGPPRLCITTAFACGGYCCNLK